MTEKLIRRHPHVFGEAEVARPPARCSPTGTGSSARSGGPRRRRPVRRRAREPPRPPLRAQDRCAAAAPAGGGAAEPRDAATRPRRRCGRDAAGGGRASRAGSGVDPELAVRAAAERLRDRSAARRNPLASRSAHGRYRDTSTRARSSTRGATRRSRSRCALESGALRPRRGPLRRLDRRVRGDRAARRRRRLGRQGRRAGGRQRQRRDRRGARSAPRATDQGAIDRDADRARRDAEQVAARRQRDPRRLAGGGAGRRARGRRAALPLPRRALRASREQATVLPVPMMNVLNGGAHADNSVDFQEFMVVPAGRAELLRVPADGHRGLPRAEGDPAASAGSRPRSATRAASRPTSSSNEAALEALVAGIEAAGYEPGDGRLHRPRPGDQRDLPRDGAYVLEHEGRTLSAEEMAAYWAEHGRPLPDRLDRGRHGRGGLGRLEAADRARSATAASWSATTSSSPTPSGCAAGSSRASPTRSSSR